MSPTGEVGALQIEGDTALSRHSVTVVALQLGHVYATSPWCRAALLGCGLGCVAIVVTDLLSCQQATMKLRISLLWAVLMQKSGHSRDSWMLPLKGRDLL